MQVQNLVLCYINPLLCTKRLAETGNGSLNKFLAEGHDMFSSVTKNERARGKNCVMVPPVYFFYWKGKFSAASTHLLKCILFFHYRLSIFYKHFRHFSYYYRHNLIATRTHQHSLLVACSLVLIFINYNLVFHCCGITFIFRILFTSLNSKRFNYQENNAINIILAEALHNWGRHTMNIFSTMPWHLPYD
jgi:hypothetical protein